VINTVLELCNRYRDAKTLRPQELYLETAYPWTGPGISTRNRTWTEWKYR